MSIKTWIYIHGYLLFTDINCRMSMHGYLCLDIHIGVHTCKSNWRLTSIDQGLSHEYGNREFLEIHVRICFGLSDQGRWTNPKVPFKMVESMRSGNTGCNCWMIEHFFPTKRFPPSKRQNTAKLSWPYPPSNNSYFRSWLQVTSQRGN